MWFVKTVIFLVIAVGKDTGTRKEKNALDELDSNNAINKLCRQTDRFKCLRRSGGSLVTARGAFGKVVFANIINDGTVSIFRSCNLSTAEEERTKASPALDCLPVDYVSPEAESTISAAIKIPLRRSMRLDTPIVSFRRDDNQWLREKRSTRRMGRRDVGPKIIDIMIKSPSGYIPDPKVPPDFMIMENIEGTELSEFLRDLSSDIRTLLFAGKSAETSSRIQLLHNEIWYRLRLYVRLLRLYMESARRLWKRHLHHCDFHLDNLRVQVLNSQELSNTNIADGLKKNILYCMPRRNGLMLAHTLVASFDVSKVSYCYAVTLSKIRILDWSYTIQVTTDVAERGLGNVTTPCLTYSHRYEDISEMDRTLRNQFSVDFSRMQRNSKDAVKMRATYSLIRVLKSHFEQILTNTKWKTCINWLQMQFKKVRRAKYQDTKISEKEYACTLLKEQEAFLDSRNIADDVANYLSEQTPANLQEFDSYEPEYFNVTSNVAGLSSLKESSVPSSSDSKDTMKSPDPPSTKHKSVRAVLPHKK